MLPAMASPAALSVMDTPFGQLVSPVNPELGSPSSLLVKDASKRKRVNRNAKLKQCKLDARREQWLAQVSIIKPGKEGRLQESPTSGKLELGEIVHRDDDESFTFELRRYASENLERVLSHSHLRVPQAGNCDVEDLKDTLSPSRSGSCVSDGFESECSPKSQASASPQGKVTKVGKDCGQGRFIFDPEENKLKEGLTGNVKLTFSPGTVDAHIAEETEHESENDDWEAAADALGLNRPQEAACCTGQSSILVASKGDLDLSPRNPGMFSKPGSSGGPCQVMARSSSGRAWRLDDEHRPASLPNLGKQQSLPARFIGHKQHWMYTPKVEQDHVSGPSLCPICAEELDSTDSSFEPCVCGFQLCLFCHHRIVLDDCRCPGCRRPYQSLLSASPVQAAGLC